MADIVAAFFGINLFDAGVAMIKSLINGASSIFPELVSAVKEAFTFDGSPSREQISAANEKGEAFGSWLREVGPEWFNNAIGNTEKVNPENSASLVGSSTLNDSRDQSQTVNVTVGGVTVQGVQNITPAVGAAVGQAVGNSAAGAVPPSRVINQGSAF